MLNRGDLLLYLCTDRELSLGRPITKAVEDSILGGVTMVQIREKDTSTNDFYEIAMAVREVTKKHRVPLVVNDRIDIALAVAADGLHIGQSDMPLPVARRLVGGDMFIGVSAGTVEQALAAQNDGADYLGVGAIYPTGSKADAGDAIGLEGLNAIRTAVSIPIVGIGGITAQNAVDIMKAGAEGVAVISAILSQTDIKTAAQVLKGCLQ